MKLFCRTTALALCGVAWAAITTPHALAQSMPAALATGQKRQFNLPAGPLAVALNAWARRSGRSMVFRSEEVANARTDGVRGWMTEAAALDRLLRGTGFVATTSGGAVAVSRLAAASPEDQLGGATPDILVTGRNSWSLNTGIKRSQDDSQPFIVMTSEEIQRSGAPNLESFLRDRLNVNSTPGTSEQVKAAGSNLPGSLQDNRMVNQINLRGLGARDTLILVDGRRQPGVNIGTGDLTQPSITGIPLAAIERIEVLASSASGIYGSGASGGVINIVLKRDFSGGEINATYGNTGDFKAGQGRVDLTYGVPLEGGRTRLSITGSWQRSEPLTYGEREELRQRKTAEFEANSSTPQAENSLGVPLGSTVNFQQARNQPLVLKPQFGGQRLAASFGSIPVGYRGIAVDGIGPLLANIGTFNRDTPDTALAPGRRAPLIYGSNNLNGSLTLRREFSSWLTGYTSVTASRSLSTTNFSRGPDSVDLLANAPNNPFTTAIRVTLPAIAEQVRIDSEQRRTSFVGGAIIKLPYEWQAAIDLSYSRSWYQNDIGPARVSGATVASLRNGQQNVLRDLTLDPLTVNFENAPFGIARSPGRSSSFLPSLRIAGPLPLRLPGGRPQLTMNIDQNVDTLQSSLNTFISGSTRSTSFTPQTRQTTTAIYGEVSFPLVAEANRIPLIRLFELRISGRGEKYRGDGADVISCIDRNFSSATTTSPFGTCPAPGAVVPRSVTRNSHVDPSVSFRWSPFASLIARGSYSTGYLPPRLSQLVPVFDRLNFSFLRDTARGGEPIVGTSSDGPEIDGYLGGNPNVRPETSKTLSFGAILTPTFIPGLRLSADWTKIKKRDVYFAPIDLFVFGTSPQGRFDTFLRVNPDRATRGPASDGFPVGPITSLDLSLVNLTGLSTEAVDFVAGYTHGLLGGTIDLNARATYVDSLLVQPYPGEPTVDYAGVAPREFAAAGGNAALRWRGSGSVTWSRNGLTVGWQTRFFDRYRLRLTGQPVGQGSPYVASQLYHDVNLSYRFPFGATLTASINNLFNKLPPLDADAFPLYYSSYADPRLRNFSLGIRKSF